MHILKVATHSLLLLTTPLSCLHAESTFPFHRKVIVTRDYPIQTLTYDEVAELVKQIESENLDVDDSEIEKINELFAYLSLQGLLPGDFDEALSLEQDIHELLHCGKDSYQYVFIPAIICDTGDIIQCKSWIEKRWEETKKFVKKHKKAILIGAALVVAATVVAIVVVSSASAAGAAAGAAAAAAPAIEEQVSSFKDNMMSGHIAESISPHDEPGRFPLEDSARILGSLLAHDTLKQTKPSFWKHDAHHGKVDERFTTDYAFRYETPGKPQDFTTLFYETRGEKALSSGYHEQAIHDFGKAIEINPTNPYPYLERGYAHFSQGSYDKSLEDFRHYTSEVRPTYPMSVTDFSLGFFKGLPRGVRDSAGDLFLFVSDFATHPLHTSGQICEAISHLASFGASGEWGTLAETLTPEVYQLVKEWDSIPPFERGELAGYAFGKHGADILIPGTAIKAVSKGASSAKKLVSICKTLKTAEKTLILESVAALETPTKIAETIHTAQKTIALGEELGLSTSEIAHLKHAGTLESTLTQTLETKLATPALRESYEFFDRAQEFLKPFSKQFRPEAEVRELIHQTGIQTFPRPANIPENFRVKLSNTGAGMKYVHPGNEQTYIRVMPGKPHSPLPYQQKPYITQMKNGKTIDRFGNIVKSDAPEAHISIEDFIYKE